MGKPTTEAMDRTLGREEGETRRRRGRLGPNGRRENKEVEKKRGRGGREGEEDEDGSREERLVDRRDNKRLKIVSRGGEKRCRYNGEREGRCIRRFRE